MFNAVPIPAFTDNYFWLLDKGAGNSYAVVDPGSAEPVLKTLAAARGTLEAIIVTHHHADHVGGIEELATRFPKVKVYAPLDSRIPGVTQVVKPWEKVFIDCLECEFDVLPAPGHTLTHIAWYGEGKLMCGDTLFGCGCGRLFEGTPRQMLDSLNLIRSLPDDTEAYCAHEYTLANIAFAKEVEPENADTQKRGEHARDLRAQNLPTVPLRLGTEKKVNSFLRSDNRELVSALEQNTGRTFRSPVEVFAYLRSWKDTF